MLPSEQVRRVRMTGTVDTGANHLVLPAAAAKQLGVPAAGKATVRYADNRTSSRTVVENVRVDLLGRHGNFKAIVEPKRADVLIGAIVLEDMDLLVDCITQTLQPRDPKGIIAEIEYSLIDELLQTNPKFQALVAKSKASPRKPFAAEEDGTRNK